MFVLCLGKRRDHSGRRRQSQTFVPTKKLQNSCFIGRAWLNFPGFYTQEIPKKTHEKSSSGIDVVPSVCLSVRVCTLRMYSIRDFY